MAKTTKIVRKKVFEKATAFGSEFKKQTATALIAGFGFIVALAWRDVITNSLKELNPAANNLLISAIIVTAFAVVGIAIINKWAKKPEENK